MEIVGTAPRLSGLIVTGVSVLIWRRPSRPGASRF
jgi:hypothetical protein